MRFIIPLLVAFFLVSAPARADQLKDGEAAFDQGNYQTALKILQPLADQGNAEAEIYIRRYSLDGGAKRDTPAAMKLRKAAEEGDADEQFRLGLRYYTGGVGQDVEQDYAEAAKWFLLAAKQGNEDAQFYLSQIYMFGRGVKKDDAEASFWQLLEAKIVRRRFYSLQFDKGRSPETPEELQTVMDHETFQKWEASFSKPPTPERAALKKRADDWKSDFSPTLKLAELGNIGAQDEIGKIYEWGIGVNQDYARAMKWFRKAAEGGSTSALFSINQMYAHGLGVKRDYSKAYFWHLIADNSNHPIGRSASASLEFSSGHLTAEQKAAVQKRVAEWCHAHGVAPPAPVAPLPVSAPLTGPQPFDPLAEWREKLEAKQREMKKGTAPAEKEQDILTSSPMDPVALKNLREEAAAGNAEAEAELGYCYWQGEGIPKDTQAALTWLRKAADQGNTEALINLGTGYLNGFDGPRDEKKTADLWRKAAELGNSEAQNEIATLYYEGKGVKQDGSEGKKWNLLSANQGNTGAQHSLAWMYNDGMRGEKINYEEAAFWFTLVVKLSDGLMGMGPGGSDYTGTFGYFQTELRSAKKNLTPEQIGVLEKRVAEWKPNLDPLIELARRGEIKAQLELGVDYVHGKLVAQDYAEGYFWLALAQQGDRRYRPWYPTNPNIGYPKWRDEAKRHMTPEQVAAADKRIAEWVKIYPTPSTPVSPR